MAAWNVLKNGGSALDAVTAGTSRCEGLGYSDGSKSPNEIDWKVGRLE